MINLSLQIYEKGRLAITVVYSDYYSINYVCMLCRTLIGIGITLKTTSCKY